MDISSFLEVDWALNYLIWRHPSIVWTKSSHCANFRGCTFIAYTLNSVCSSVLFDQYSVLRLGFWVVLRGFALLRWPWAYHCQFSQSQTFKCVLKPLSWQIQSRRKRALPLPPHTLVLESCVVWIYVTFQCRLLPRMYSLPHLIASMYSTYFVPVEKNSAYV